MRATVVITVLVLASLMLSQSREAADRVSEDPPLPKIAPAPGFTLTSQDGTPVSLVDFRGKVVAVTFIYTLCTDTCPVLTPMKVKVCSADIRWRGCARLGPRAIFRTRGCFRRLGSTLRKRGNVSARTTFSRHRMAAASSGAAA